MSRILKAGSVRYDESDAVKIGTGNFPKQINSEITSDEQYYDDGFTRDSGQEQLEAARLEAGVILQNAENEADNILYNASMEAEQIIDGARKEGEMILKDAQTDGYNVGYREGKEATTKMQKEAKQALDEGKKKRDQLIAGVEKEIVDIIAKTVHKLIFCEADLNPKVIISLIHQGFADATLTGEIKVHVSKDDYDGVLARKDEILEKAVGSAGVEIVKNLSMRKGDCLIETPYGNIDCSLEQQFNALKKNLYYLLENGSLGAADRK